MHKKKKEAFKWGVTLVFALTLWFTGWHQPLIAGVQRAILLTGIIQPDINEETVALNSETPDLFFIDEAGKNIKLSDFTGKTLFINIWASWCPPCKAEMPGIQNLYEDVKGENIHFIMISTDRNFDLAKKYKEKNEYTFPIYSLNSSFPPAMDGRSIPRTYVLDGNGTIRMQHIGMAQYDTKEFREFLNQLSNETQ